MEKVQSREGGSAEAERRADWQRRQELVADVPGATRESVSVQLEKGQLTIEATRQGTPEGTPLAEEFRPADYARAFAIPQGIDASKIDAQLSSGVLRLRLPKSDALKPRRIVVRGG